MENKENKEPMFVVLYNAGEGIMHEVMLKQEHQVLIGNLLMKLYDDNIPVSKEIVGQFKIHNKKKEISNE